MYKLTSITPLAGSLVTQGVGVPFSTDDLWPFVFLPNILFVLFSMALFAFVYESPQFIMEKEGNRDRVCISTAPAAEVCRGNVDRWRVRRPSNTRARQTTVFKLELTMK